MSDDQERTVTTVRQVGDFTITHKRTYGPALPAPEPWVSKPRPDFAQAMRRVLEVHRRQNPRLHLSGPPAEPARYFDVPPVHVVIPERERLARLRESLDYYMAVYG